MNRRTALTLPLFLGGLTPATLWAQGGRRKVSTSRKALEPAVTDADETTSPTNDSPSSLINEPGFQWATYDISRYCKLDTGQSRPQQALIDWIFKRTGAAEWHGERASVLFANRTMLRAYNRTEVLKQVDEVVERFVKATDDTLSVHVQYIAAVDTRWRYTVFSQLTFVGSGPQGQQIWTMRPSDAALILSQMQLQQGFRSLLNKEYPMVNGQTMKIASAKEMKYTSGLKRDGAGGPANQPRGDKLEEGIFLKISPLLTFDGDAIDAMIDLRVNTIRSFHRTRVIAPREQPGSPEIGIDVPEATQTHLEQTVMNWPLGQTLVISAGIHPGILDNKGGWFNLPIPGTYPTGTEVLVFLDIETSNRGRPARDDDPRARTTPARPRSRPSDDSDTGTVDVSGDRDQR
jgi:hypothetical protein